MGRLVSLRVGENLTFTNRVPANDAIDLGSIKESKAIKVTDLQCEETKKKKMLLSRNIYIYIG